MLIECRDWAATLWRASYMGFPFYFESDDEEGGRTLKIHEYPNSDNYYVEDTGQAPRYYSGTAYVHGDDADTQAIAFAETLSSPGPGTLVIPILGPIQVQAMPWKRTASKDQFGYIAFAVKFVRQGNATALTSVALLGQQIFDAADAAAQALAGAAPGALTLNLPANFVIAAGVDAVLGAVAAIETVRLANPVDAATSAQVAAASLAIANAAPLLILNVAVNPGDVANLLDAVAPLPATPSNPVAVLAATLVANIRLLGDGMAGNTDAGAGALLGLALEYPYAEPVTLPTANATAAAANRAAISNLMRLAALTAWCEALQRQPYPDRPTGVAARAAAAERLADELEHLAGAAAARTYEAIKDLRGAVVSWLTQLVVNLAPVITVSAARSMPAVWWAWRLYGDPTRQFDLVLRNKVPHPAFMPLSFQALAAGYAAPPSLPTAWPAS
jgi:prophage DNA circulation protein